MSGTIQWRWCAVFLVLVHCSDEAPPAPVVVDAGRDVLQPTYTIEQLKDPETCNTCHTKHYRDWSGSMHAYASDDPLFLAMNERGQREANIGNFCVQCHAPMAVLAAGPDKVVDTAMLKSLPRSERGVTCYFCHNVEDVTSTHNNPLVLAGDNVMRGRFNDAVPNEAHRSAYSKLLDGEHLESSNMCGACHDIVNAKGAHVERTFAEWKETVFSAPIVGLTCAQCHVNPSPRPEVIADGPVTGVYARTSHDHRMPAVDKAITPFPELLAQEEGIRKELNYPPVLQTGLCVAYYGTDSKIVVITDNLQAGHKFPSGAAQDRQLWFEVTAFQGGNKIFESGHVEQGQDASHSSDPNIWLIRDCMFDEQGKKTHMFWESKTSDSNVLPGPLTLNPLDPRFYQTHVTRAYPLASNERIPIPDRIELRVWLQPFPFEAFDDLTPELKTLGYNDAEILGFRGKLEPMLITTKAAAGVTEPGVLEWTEQAAKDTPGGTFRNTAPLLKDVARNVDVQCVTGTGMRMGVDTRPAPKHTTCAP
jgi:hypothetical protein